MKELLKLYRVYQYINQITNQRYIGTTCLSQYERAGKNGKNYIDFCSAFGEAIKQDGWENFKYEVLEDGLTKEEAFEREREYIKKFNTIYPFGYNLEDGGLHPHSHEKTKEKISQKNKGANNPMFNHSHSLETREKMSQNHADFSGEKNPNYGKKHPGMNKGNHLSEEQKQKLSDFRKGKHWFNDGVKSIQAYECPGEGWISGRIF